MKKREARISTTAIAEVKSFQDEVAGGRRKKLAPASSDNNTRKPLDHYNGQIPWRSLNTLAVFAEEELGYDGIWRPVRFNQEAEFEDADVEDWAFRKGDWTDEN